MALTVKIAGSKGLLSQAGSNQELTCTVTGGVTPITYTWTVAGTNANQVTITPNTDDNSKAVVAYSGSAKTGSFTVKCAVTDSTESTALTGNATLAMTIADPAPDRYTGAWANAYMAAMPAEAQQRFAAMQVIHEIPIPNDAKVLHSEQMNIVMDAI